MLSPRDCRLVWGLRKVNQQGKWFIHGNEYCQYKQQSQLLMWPAFLCKIKCWTKLRYHKTETQYVL